MKVGLKIKISLILLLLLVLGLCRAGGITVQAEDYRFTIDVEKGFNGGRTVSGRYAPFYVTVTNKGADFSGNLEILVMSTDTTISMYQKPLVLAEGEKKKIYFSVYMQSSGNDITIRVTKDEKVLKEVGKPADLFDSDNIVLFGGLLSDAEVSEYPFINDLYMWKMDPKQLPQDVNGYSMLDFIVIDDFDLGSLPKEDISRLTEWVEKGGTILLGTGSTYMKTLMSFDKDFLSGKAGSVEPIILSDGVDEAQVDMLNLTLEDAALIYGNNECPLIYELNREDGKLLVATIGLKIPGSLIYSIGAEISSLIGSHISVAYQERYNENLYGNNEYKLVNALDQTSSGKVANVGQYALVLILYIVIVGPVLYLVLKKIDKRQLTWVMVPVFSLVFAGIIYLLGSSTRMTEPFLSYISMLTYEGNEDTDQVREEIHYAVMAPHNRTYSLYFENGYQLYPETGGNSYYSYGNATGEIMKDYDIGFKEYGEGLEIEFKDPAAFERYYFNGSGTTEKVGNYRGGLNRQLNRIVGEFTNELGYDINYAFLISGNMIYYIGNIPGGQTINVNTEDLNRMYIGNYYDGYNAYDFICNNLFQGISSYELMEYSGIISALDYYLGSSSMEGKTYIMGIAENADQIGIGLASQIEMDSSGTTLVKLELPLVQEGSEDYVPNMDTYLKDVLAGSFYGYGNRYLGEEDVICTYEVPEDEEWKGIYYEEYLNPEFGYQSNYGNFNGTVLFFNWETEVYDEIFQSGVAGELLELNSYIGTDRSVMICYRPDTAGSPEKENLVPILSLIKEDKN